MKTVIIFIQAQKLAKLNLYHYYMNSGFSGTKGTFLGVCVIAMTVAKCLTILQAQKSLIAKGVPVKHNKSEDRILLLDQLESQIGTPRYLLQDKGDFAT